MPRKYDYYYLNGVEQFTFYQLPKELLENPIFAELSLDAKILYAILRDKMSLSRSNKWIDEEGRVYILYSVTNIMKDMSIGKGKALKHLAELEEFNLIEKHQRNGQTTLIYVKNFAAVVKELKNGKGEEKEEAVRKPNQSENRTSPKIEPVRKSNRSENRTGLKTEPVSKSNRSENRTASGSKIERVPVRKSDQNNTDIKDTDVNDNNSFSQRAIERMNETESPVVTIRMDETLTEKQSESMRRILEEQNGIPYAFIMEPDRMKQVVLYLCDWQHIVENGNRERTRIYRLLAENLTEMALERNLWDCKGSRISYRHVIDKINAIYSGDHYGLYGIIERVADRFLEARKQTDIGSPKMYLKAMLWEALCSFEVETDAYYTRQVHVDYGY